LVIDPIPNTCPLSDDSGQNRILVGGLSANDPKRTLTVRCFPLLDRATNKKFWVEYDEIFKICPLCFSRHGGLIGAPLRPTAAQEPYKAQIDALRKSLEKYKDYKVTVRDLYLSTVGCVHYAGEKMAHYMEYPKGAMGVHFINVTVRGAPDPMKPNVLIYEPVGKELKLVAVEWLVPLTPDTKKRPSLFGQPFMGPMEGHEPLIPKEYVMFAMALSGISLCAVRF
jgi:hypothetical protein